MTALMLIPSRAVKRKVGGNTCHGHVGARAAEGLDGERAIALSRACV